VRRNLGDRVLPGTCEDHQAVGDRKAGLLEAGAVERLASGSRRIGGA
jgi:hypothetical protein